MIQKNKYLKISDFSLFKMNFYIFKTAIFSEYESFVCKYVDFILYLNVNWIF